MFPRQLGSRLTVERNEHSLGRSLADPRVAQVSSLYVDVPLVPSLQATVTRATNPRSSEDRHSPERKSSTEIPSFVDPVNVLYCETLTLQTRVADAISIKFEIPPVSVSDRASAEFRQMIDRSMNDQVSCHGSCVFTLTARKKGRHCWDSISWKTETTCWWVWRSKSAAIMLRGETSGGRKRLNWRHVVETVSGKERHLIT